MAEPKQKKVLEFKVEGEPQSAAPAPDYLKKFDSMPLMKTRPSPNMWTPTPKQAEGMQRRELNRMVMKDYMNRAHDIYQGKMGDAVLPEPEGIPAPMPTILYKDKYGMVPGKRTFQGRNIGGAAYPSNPEVEI